MPTSTLMHDLTLTSMSYIYLIDNLMLMHLHFLLVTLTGSLLYSANALAPTSLTNIKTTAIAIEPIYGLLGVPSYVFLSLLTSFGCPQTNHHICQ